MGRLPPKSRLNRAIGTAIRVELGVAAGLGVVAVLLSELGRVPIGRCEPCSVARERRRNPA